MHPHTSNPYPDNPNCKTSFEVPFSLSHCPAARRTTLASSWYFEGLIRIVHIHKNHEQTENGNDERHVESKAEEVLNRMSKPIAPSENGTENWWRNLETRLGRAFTQPDGCGQRQLDVVEPLSLPTCA